jgi:RNA polymerase sigma factor for flagellar operon FliA
MPNQIENPENPANAFRDELIISHLPLAKQITGKISAKLPPHVDRDDLMSAAIIGLIMAAERFDPSRGVQFRTFADQRIRGTIIDELRSQDWLTRSLREKFKQLEREFSSLEQKLGRNPSSEEVAGSMGMGMEEYFKLLDDVHYLSVVSIDDSWEDNEGSPFGLLDVLENEAADGPLDLLTQQQTAGILSQAINELPDNERQVICRYYYEDKSLREIGEGMDLKESRICQLHGQAILRLRVKMKHLR